MSPEQANTVSDHESVSSRRGRPPAPRDEILKAATALFADASTPAAVSMDDIATAAGVGKGTLFRAFGSRDGLLDAMFAAQLEPLREELERPGSQVGPDAEPADRVVALLELLLDFKLENPKLVSARELSGSDLLQAPHYKWVHEKLRNLIVQAGSQDDSAGFSAHLLLNGLRADLIAELVASGATREDLHKNLNQTARRLLG